MPHHTSHITLTLLSCCFIAVTDSTWWGTAQCLQSIESCSWWPSNRERWEAAKCLVCGIIIIINIIPWNSFLVRRHVVSFYVSIAFSIWCCFVVLLFCCFVVLLLVVCPQRYSFRLSRMGCVHHNAVHLTPNTHTSVMFFFVFNNFS